MSGGGDSGKPTAGPTKFPLPIVESSARAAETAEPTEPGESDLSRRHALRALLGATAGAMAAGAFAATTSENAVPHPDDKKPGIPEDAPKKGKHQWGMAIDLDRCTGCGGCTVACQVENNIPAMGPELSAETQPIKWMDLISSAEGTYPDLKMQMLPVPCMHCEDAPCTKVCPVNATFKTDEGITAQIWDRCIGCRYCMSACPYSRRYFNWTDPAYAQTELSALNPAVATRPVGVVEKCTFCYQRIRAVKDLARSEERELTDEELRRLPACAAACPAQAITFGDLANPKSEVTRLHKSPRATRLLEELGTKPRVVYLRERKWKE